MTQGGGGRHSQHAARSGCVSPRRQSDSETTDWVFEAQTSESNVEEDGSRFSHSTREGRPGEVQSPGQRREPRTQSTQAGAHSEHLARGDINKQKAGVLRFQPGNGRHEVVPVSTCRIIHSGRTVNGGHKLLKNYKQKNSNFTGESLAVTT